MINDNGTSNERHPSEEGEYPVSNKMVSINRYSVGKISYRLECEERGRNIKSSDRHLENGGTTVNYTLYSLSKTGHTHCTIPLHTLYARPTLHTLHTPGGSNVIDD